MKPDNIFKNERGLGLIVVFVAFLVLFTTFSLVKISSLNSIQPDLRRIGINVGADATPNPLADAESSNPNQADAEAGNGGALTIASDSLDIDADVDIDSEGDTPPYIE